MSVRQHATTAEEPERRKPREWVETLRLTVTAFREQGLTDWAAALTYFAVLSIFPLLLVFVALIGLFGQYPQTVNAILDIVQKVAPGSTVDTVRSTITSIVRNKGGAGALFGVGLIAALWSASGYVGAFGRAANAIHGVEEDRPFWKLRPLLLAVTSVLVILLAALALGFVVTGSVARSIGDQVGVGHGAVTAWNIAKWPAMLVLVVVMLAILGSAVPNVGGPRFRLITPGAALALIVLIVASAGFAFYVGNFGSYNKTYGTLGGVIVFLVWMWIANISLLFGVEFDVTRRRRREGVEAPPPHRAGNGARASTS